jgi:biotin transport system substrate-specific component
MEQTLRQDNVLISAENWPAKLVMVVGGSLLLWAAAKVQVPFWPVPMTLHTLAIFLIVGALGLRLGTAAVALYVLEGALGLPVFSGTPQRGIGLAYMMGPTGGYILGFLLAALAIGWLAEVKGWSRSVPKLFAAFLIGLALIYIPGLIWLAQFTGWNKVLALGFTPFIAADVVKALVAALILPAAWRLKRAA